MSALMEEELLRERQLVRQMHLQLTAIITALGHGVCEVAFDELPARVAMLMDERDRTARECNENAKGWKDVRECLERVMQMRADGSLFVPMARATQLWPNEMPACQIVDGGILVNAKTVAFAAQDMMHKVYEQSEVLRRALTKITRNQSENPGEEGICPFGCDAPWIALSALGLWKDETIAAWRPEVAA